jgi:hypothetical protein
MQKEEKKRKKDVENILSKTAASSSNQSELSKAIFNFKLKSLLCERIAAQRDIEQKKYRREQHQHNQFGFEVYLLKPELLRGIIECGFHHPSEGLKIKGKFKKIYNEN